MVRTREPWGQQLVPEARGFSGRRPLPIKGWWAGIRDSGSFCSPPPPLLWKLGRGAGEEGRAEDEAQALSLALLCA